MDLAVGGERLAAGAAVRWLNARGDHQFLRAARHDAGPARAAVPASYARASSALKASAAAGSDW